MALYKPLPIGVSILCTAAAPLFGIWYTFQICVDSVDS